MDLKTGFVCSLPVVLLICAACSEAFALRKPENEDLVSALARLDRALGEMISKSDGSIPYKRNEGSPMRRFPIDGDVPYKRDDGPTPYKRGWWLSKPNKESPPHYDDLDEDSPYKRQDYGDDTRSESLDRVLRYLLDMEDRLHERTAEKRDHDIPFPFVGRS